MRTPILVSMLGLSLLACRGSDTNNVDAPPNPNADAPVGGVVHIQDVQNDMMAPGTAVQLRGVVVTAIDNFGMKTGDFWVEEVGGGERSGVHVFGAPPAMVSPLALGDVVDINGAVKDEFALSSDTSGNTVTELGAGPSGITIIKKSSGTVPAPVVVDALAIGQLATPALRNAEWEKWEGVLITVNNVAALNAPKCVGSACTDPTLQNFTVTGEAVVESSLAAFPTTGVASQACLASVTGVVDYFFDYLILPRTTTEVATGGTACVIENTAALCGDNMDNDGNGFTDCMDNGCIIGSATCRMTSTIAAIQATTPTMAVELDDVFVTAVAHNKRSFWASTALTQAANGGVFVFRSGDMLDASVVPGAKVTVIGTVTEFNDDTAGGTLTELNGLSVSMPTGTPGVVVPVSNQTAAQLLVAGTAPTFESVLVTLTNVNITALGSATNGFIASAKQAGQVFSMGTDVLQLAAADMGCYASITGLWTNLEAASSGATTKPNAFGFIPVTLTGKGTGTCN